MAGEHEAENERLDRTVRFGRDLLVNVAGNLVTAAVIYLAAVVGGLLPRSWPLISASLAVVAFVLSNVLMIKLVARDHRLKLAAPPFHVSRRTAVITALTGFTAGVLGGVAASAVGVWRG